MSRVAWITGAGGLIGSHIVRAAPAEWSARGLTRAELELTDFDAVRSAFARERPQLVIHCAAMSKAAECERDPKRAHLNNVEVTKVLCELAADIPLLFFSSDLVFDGTRGNYNENDPPNPIHVYGESKAAAERAVLNNPQHTVIRAALTAGSTPAGNRSFDEQMRAAWMRGEVTSVFADEFRSPITAPVVARAIWELVQAERPGLYHLGGAQRMSRLEIARTIAEQTPKIAARIQSCSLRDFAGPRRSPDTSLDSAKIQRVLSFRLPDFAEALRNPAGDLSKAE